MRHHLFFYSTSQSLLLWCTLEQAIDFARGYRQDVDVINGAGRVVAKVRQLDALEF